MSEIDVRVVWVSFDSIGRDCVKCAAAAGAEIVGIVTLPEPVRSDRAAQVSFADTARELDAQLVFADDINSSDCLAEVRSLRPDMLFVVGWSQLLGTEAIRVAPKGVFGMHPTMLPRHRGRAPIPWALLTGLAKTGVTLFEICDPSADSGLIVAQAEVLIDADESATTLFDKIARAHVELVRECMPRLLAGDAPRLQQDERRASNWPRRIPRDGLIDWETKAPYLYDWVRAQTRPYPGAFTWVGDSRLIVWRARVMPGESAAPAGTIVEQVAGGFIVACGEGLIVLEEVELLEGSGFERELLMAGTRLG